MKATESTATMQTTSGDAAGQSGIPDIARTTGEIRRQCEDAWRNAIDAVLAWREVDRTDPDAPRVDAIDTAIDFAWDHQQAATAPAGIAWSGDGGLVFEWRATGEAMTIEFVGRGEAELTRFRDCRVIESFQLRRNPTTRRLEGRRGS